MLIWQGKCPVSDASQSAPQSQSDAIHQPARKCGESGCTENRVPSGTAPKKGLHATTSFSDNNSQTSSLQLCPALCPPLGRHCFPKPHRVYTPIASKCSHTKA